MLRYIGVICIFMFAFYAIFCFERYQKARLLQGEAFLLLLKFLRGELEGCGRPPAECLRDFHCDALCRTAFFSAVLEGASLKEAYGAEGGSLSLPQGMDAILVEAFSSFGRGGRKEECRRISEASEKAEALLSSERGEHARRLTLCRTLTTAAAMGIVILLL